MSYSDRKRLLFYLCRKLGIDVELKRKEIREKFGLVSMKDIKPYQLDVILDQLNEEYARRTVVQEL